MVSDKQIEANRQNALLSTGPATAARIEAARFNVLRHGLHSLQTVILGGAPESWEAHRAGVAMAKDLSSWPRPTLAELIKAAIRTPAGSVTGPSRPGFSGLTHMGTAAIPI